MYIQNLTGLEKCSRLPKKLAKYLALLYHVETNSLIQFRYDRDLRHERVKQGRN